LAFTLALRQDGALFAWGNDGEGALGDGSNSVRRVSSPLQILTNEVWKAGVAGYGQTFAIREDGSLWALGKNDFGQLGYGSVTSANDPRLIQAGASWKGVAVGERHTLALRADGTLWGWGDNLYGQLGNGSNRFGANPPQQVGTNTSWTAIAAGLYHSIALRADGSLWTWGANFEGQLGNGLGGAGRSTNAPQPIATNFIWKASAAGDGHTLA
jgi:alpha-tubulin suppressor-like RCC1 family protein